MSTARIDAPCPARSRGSTDCLVGRDRHVRGGGSDGSALLHRGTVENGRELADLPVDRRHPGEHLGIVEEGGYEADSSMIYYGFPTRWAPAIEEKIVAKVHELVGR